MSSYEPAPSRIPDDTFLLSYSPRIRKLLLSRDIKTEQEAMVFLNPDWERDTHDPFLMKGMEQAVSRILRAVEKNETIALWSDYDMDGIPGAVALFDFFHAIGYERVIHVTPHRNKDGFGLNTDGIDELAGQGVSCLITVDCGSNDVEQVAHAHRLGIDTVITDHHIVPDELPSAVALLNPKQRGCEYPEKMLCGAGVAFKLVQALLVRMRESGAEKIPAPGWEKWLLDLVGMATLSDMVPLTGENRTFAYFGLLVLRKSRRPGLQALLKKAKTNQKFLTEDDVSFSIAPRINAASRMGHARDAFSLLSSSDITEAGGLAELLEQTNNERKVAVAAMKREINRKLGKRSKESAVVVLGNPDWKPSLLGLVAGSLANDMGKPVFLWGRESGTTIKGSCRSKGSTSVFALMQSVKERFIEYGGHAFSGGFTLHEEAVHTLEPALEKALADLGSDSSEQVLVYDDELSIDEVTWDTYREVSRLAPFGEMNRKPIFLIRNVRLDSVRTFGKGNEHVEFIFVKQDGGTVKAIRFFSRLDSFKSKLMESDSVSFVANLEASYFFKRPELRLRLVEIL